MVHAILEDVGVNPERFALDWASAAEAPRFVDLITAFTRKIEGLGPMGQVEGKEREELLVKLAAARQAAGIMKVRAGLGNLAKDFRKEGDYGLDVVKRKIDEKLGPMVKSEVGGQEILLRLERQGPLSTADLAGRVGWSPEEIGDYLAKLGKKGQVAERNGRWMLAQANKA